MQGNFPEVLFIQEKNISQGKSEYSAAWNIEMYGGYTFQVSYEFLGDLYEAAYSPLLAKNLYSQSALRSANSRCISGNVRYNYQLDNRKSRAHDVIDALEKI